MEIILKSGTASEIDQQLVDDFASKLSGALISATDSNYDEVRKVYNGMIDKKPGLIVKCADVADVIYSVNFARTNNLLTAVRGAGHNAGGLGSCDGGIVIDLSGIKFIKVNTNDNTVYVGGGNTLNELDHATHPFGLAVPGGMVSSTGVGGLTLGGGVGYLSRKYGLTIDNLLEADMVLADGSFVTVNEKQNTDLYWAIRGGGGNFGVVTSFKFQAHPVKMIYGGPTFWPIEKTEDIMEWYHEFVHNATEDLNGFVATLEVPGPPFPPHMHNQKYCAAVWCYTGNVENVEEVFKPVRDKNPELDLIGEIPYPALQSLFDGLLPSGLQWYWKADFFNDIPKEAAALHKKFGSEIPTPLSQMHLYPISGAAGRVGKNDTPWVHREAKYAGVFVGIDPDPANADKITQWTKDYWAALHPYSSGGVYLNFIMDEGQEPIKASYGENYERLVQIKQKYDPDNFFRMNQNIKP